MREVEPADVWDARPADGGFMAALATLCVLAWGLELVVDGAVLTLTGSVSTYLPYPLQLPTWVVLGLAWTLVAYALGRWSRRRGLDPWPSRRPGPLSHRTWTRIVVCFLAAVLIAILVPVLAGGAWSVAPIRVYTELYALHGPGAWALMVAWACYHVGRSVLIACFVGYAQRGVAITLASEWAHRVPWGGALGGLVLGAVVALVAGPVVGLSAFACCVLLGGIHVLSGESLRVTAGLAVVIFLFL